jgi:ribosome-binding factor A
MSKPSYPRARRVNAIVHEVVAEEIERLTDPRLAMVTVTAVSVAPDMRRATVFFSSFDLSQLAEAQAGLRAAAPRLRLAIGREVRIKFSPVLEFVPDQGVLQGEKIEALLRELTSDKDEPTDE